MKDLKAHTRNREVQLQSLQDKIGDLRVKLNQTKKQNDYDAIRNQIAHDNAAVARMEDEILADLHQGRRGGRRPGRPGGRGQGPGGRGRDDSRQLGGAGRSHATSNSRNSKTAIISAEQVIPDDQRDQYRRVVKQRGADAMAHIEITDQKRREEGACSGCFVAVTSQMMNELRMADALTFCMTCGRILYLAEEDVNHIRREVS